MYVICEGHHFHGSGLSKVLIVVFIPSLTISSITFKTVILHASDGQDEVGFFA
jgi:hypothetical protein